MVLLGLTSRRKCVWLGSVVAEVLEVLVAWRSEVSREGADSFCLVTVSLRGL